MDSVCNFGFEINHRKVFYCAKKKPWLHAINTIRFRISFPLNSPFVHDVEMLQVATPFHEPRFIALSPPENGNDETVKDLYLHFPLSKVKTNTQFFEAHSAKLRYINVTATQSHGHRWWIHNLGMTLLLPPPPRLQTVSKSTLSFPSKSECGFQSSCAELWPAKKQKASSQRAQFGRGNAKFGHRTISRRLGIDLC